GATGRHFAARAVVEEAERVGFLRYARRQGGQLNEVASVQREVRYLLGRDHLAKGGGRGFDGDFGGADFNHRRNRRRVEREIDLALFVDLQADVLLLSGLETLGLHSDGVSRHRQQRGEVVT